MLCWRKGVALGYQEANLQDNCMSTITHLCDFSQAPVLSGPWCSHLYNGQGGLLLALYDFGCQKGSCWFLE